jgi:hypothetical protein
MKFGRYLVLMASSWVVAAVLAAGFSLLVDPMGISPIRIAIAGFNQWKPLREEHDWIVKRYDVSRKQPTTIFMGSSRIKQTVDPRLVAGTEFAPAYNGGINGSANFAEVKSFLQYYLTADKNLRHVFIEAFAPALFARRETMPARPDPLLDAALPKKARPPMIQFGLASDLADFASVFFSVGGLSSAVRTVSVNRGQRNLPVAGSFDDGFAPIALAPHHFSVRNVFNFVLHTRFMQRDMLVSPVTIVAAKEMIAACKLHQAECRFFVSPLHADVLFAAYHLGLWPELEELKRTLAELAPTYDFTRYNHIIDERIGPVVYWPEAFHFSPALGELVAKAMTGLRTADMPQNFGVVLDAKNIDSSLAAWREERDSWIVQRPDSVERMRKAEENLQKGVSFKSVTDAEIAAGGW